MNEYLLLLSLPLLFFEMKTTTTTGNGNGNSNGDDDDHGKEIFFFSFINEERFHFFSSFSTQQSWSASALPVFVSKYILFLSVLVCMCVCDTIFDSIHKCECVFGVE